MSKRAELLKSIVKGGLNESPTLDKYLKSRGINPQFVSKDVKVAHSKSLAFLSWQRAHQNEEVQLESADQEDTITFDIPLLIRMLEYAREDAKTDMDLHKVVKKLIAIRDQGTLTMNDYEFVTKIKEEIEINEDLRKWFSKTDPEGGWKRINSKGEAIGPCAREPGEPKPKCMSNEKRAQLSKKERASAVAAKRKHDPVADRSGKGGKPVNVSNFGKGKLSEEDIDEACWDTHKQVGMKKKGNRMVPDCVPKNEEVEILDEKNSPTNPKLWSRAKALARSKFDVYPSAYANGWASKWYKSKGGGWKSVKEETVTEDTLVEKTKEMSKSVRIIKSIYKKKGVKEELYDHEKEDKSVKGYGKKPKMSSVNTSFGEAPKSAAVLSGGTTMTGQKRDTVEIDPLMRGKPNGRFGDQKPPKN